MKPTNLAVPTHGHKKYLSQKEKDNESNNKRERLSNKRNNKQGRRRMKLVSWSDEIEVFEYPTTAKGLKRGAMHVGGRS
jgi:hypothetical protein